MKKILFFMCVITLLIGCQQSNNYEPSILLGSNYHSVESKLGKPNNKNTVNGLNYQGPIGESGYDYEVFFSRDSGNYYTKNGEIDLDRIDEIGVNFKGFLPDEKEALKFVNKFFLNNTANFIFAKREVDSNYPQFSNVFYISDNTDLKNVGVIIVNLFEENNEVKNIVLTSTNDKELLKIRTGVIREIDYK